MVGTRGRVRTSHAQRALLGCRPRHCRGIVVVVDRALAELGRGLVQDTRWLYGVVRCAVGAVFIL